ncbi:MAG: PEGA domain-containing protein [Deltaproteobacteria bacterium]|nr:PEGA domain-containing protein [Deltaproteobacteria bacterium]
MLGRHVFAGLALLGCVAGEAQAQTRVAVVRLDAGPPPAGLAALLEAASAEGVALRTLDETEIAVLAGTAPPPFAQRLAVAAELVRQAAELHAELEHQPALERLAQARLILVTEVPAAEARQALRDVRFLEGSALLALGRAGDAARAFRASRRLDPQWSADPGVVPPQVIVAWEASGRRPPADVGRVAIRSEPAGAQVFIDGVPAGTTPVVVESVEAGTVALALEREGHRRIVVPVEVGAGRVEDVSFTLDPLAAGERLREARLALDGQRPDPSVLRRIRDVLEVDRLIAVSAGQVFLVDERPAGEATEVSLDAAAAAVQRWLAPPPPAVAQVARPTPGRRPTAATSSPFYGRWWFWTAAGTAVAGGVALALALTMDPGREIELHITER